MIKNILIEKINPHPVNAEIYGDLSIESLSPAQKEEFLFLVDSIKRNGVLEPIVIDQYFTIISGERRYQACIFLEMKEVPTRQYSYENDLSRMEHLLDENISRVKTNTQRIKEGEIREKLIETRKKEVLNESSESTLRDVIGKQIGMSGKSYAVGKEVLHAVTKLKEEGKEAEADDLEKTLNKSVSGAAKAIKNDEPPIDSDYGYKIKLKAMTQLIDRSIRSLEKDLKSDSPAAFTWLIQNMKEDLAQYQTWLGDMTDCPVCKGTMFLADGSSCRSCIRGKVGEYQIPRPRNNADLN